MLLGELTSDDVAHTVNTSGVVYSGLNFSGWTYAPMVYTPPPTTAPTSDPTPSDVITETPVPSDPVLSPSPTPSGGGAAPSIPAPSAGGGALPSGPLNPIRRTFTVLAENTPGVRAAGARMFDALTPPGYEGAPASYGIGPLGRPVQVQPDGTAVMEVNSRDMTAGNVGRAVRGLFAPDKLESTATKIIGGLILSRIMGGL